MSLAYTILFSLINNLDNIGVRIAYSIRGIKITTMKNLWISVITFFISTISTYFGAVIFKYFNNTIACLISMLTLVIMGLWMIKDSRNNNSQFIKNPEKADLDNSLNIDFKEATFLGIILSINNVGGCLSAGMLGLNAFFLGIFSALISFVSLWLGNYISDFFRKYNLGNKASITAGILLILLGIKQIL